MTTKNAVVIGVQKEGSDVIINIKVAKEIEEFFEKLSKAENGDNYIQQSNRWFDKDGAGLKFYKSSSAMDEKLRSYYGVTNNYGDGLMDSVGTRINIALIRSVGASAGITVKTNDLIGYEEVRVYMERLADFTKVFYRNYLKKLNIKAKVSFEF
jgi:hypothetical protein